MKMLKKENNKIGVIGGGSWGTALANLLGHKGFKIDLWVFEREVRDEINKNQENKMFLPGISLSPNVTATTDMEKAAFKKDILLIVVPSHVMRETALKLSKFVSEDMIIISASKGIENKTHMSMSGILREILPSIPMNHFAVLSGPSFAKEVANNVPTLICAASEDNITAMEVQGIFSTPFFRVYTNNDIIGVELGGAVKNVIAIASGVVDGLGFGLNTRAALITRGQTEIRRLGLKMGAQSRTFSGLSGIGDLILTSTGDLSRNYTVGKKIGKGKKLEDILSQMHMVAEGVKTSKSVYNLSRKLDVEMPICHSIYKVLYEDLSPEKGVHQLMTRELKNELDE